MTLTETLILVTYFFVLSMLAIYGWHRYYLVYLYMKNKDKAPAPLPPLEVLPPVTVQLPIFNEMYVADRLIGAVCELDYPRELLEIQVLDDVLPATARTVTGEERERLWALMRQIWPAYDEYQTKTDRQIPVVVLTPKA